MTATTSLLDARSATLERAADRDHAQWLQHIGTAAGCTQPVRLTGRLHTINPDTGDILATRTTATMPDGVLYVPCGNRRADVCPSCAELYRADTYHLIKAGLLGGKGTPETVASHPAVFATFTAPSFGPVHTRAVEKKSGRIKPCRIRRAMTLCPHGKPTWCSQRHHENASCLGKPLCPECYDYPAHAVWNAFASELWRRTTITLRRLVARLGKHHGATLDVSYGKVAEYQHRGIVHFHAIIRLDRRDPTDPDAILPPPPNITSADLDQFILDAARATAYRTPPHPGTDDIPARPDGWLITWGQQLVNRPLTRVGGIDITEEMVAGYVAKYATKSTETTGHLSRRLTSETIGRYADYQTHTGTLIATCWDLGANPHDPGTPDDDRAYWYPPGTTDEAIARQQWQHTYGKLRRWAHMLGFGGHFTTKSGRYGPTRKTIRRVYQRSQQILRNGGHRTAEHLDEDTTLIVGDLTYAGIGWLTLGDAELAATSAAKAREYAATRKLERHAA
ncbi:replication initiator [Qaidamihabitans albus]|uniref:replication initiator n=1 Tax=Qaidamihabitans albus TaxID=2795733 RepID=UPI001F48B8C8|nr:replication initiator [Qaidamihabitans albus]